MYTLARHGSGSSIKRHGYHSRASTKALQALVSSWSDEDQRQSQKPQLHTYRSAATTTAFTSGGFYTISKTSLSMAFSTTTTTAAHGNTDTGSDHDHPPSHDKSQDAQSSPSTLPPGPPRPASSSWPAASTLTLRERIQQRPGSNVARGRAAAPRPYRHRAAASPRPAQPPKKHMLELQQRQREQQARAQEAGLPVPPLATGKGGRGKLIFPESDSFRFVLHIRELTQVKNLAGVLNALTIAERKEGGVDVHGYNACIGGMAKAKRWADALNLLSRMRAAGVAPNSHCFANAIQACCRCGQFDYVPALRRQMLTAGVPQTLNCYRLQLEHFGNSGQWQAALDLLSELKAAGLTPDAKIYNGILDAFAQSVEWNAAGKVMREMELAGHELHARSFRGAIVAAANAGEWRVSWRLLKRMHSLGVETSSRSPVIYSSVTAACGAAGSWEEALHALRMTSQKGLMPTRIAFNATLGALGKAGQWRHARKVLEDMRQDSSAGGFRTPLKATGAAETSGMPLQGELPQAPMRAESYRGRRDYSKVTPRPDVFSYTSVITACAKAGELERAVETFHDMRRARVEPNLITYNALISACGPPRGDWRRALSFVEEMLNSGLTPDDFTLTTVIAACEAARGGEGEWDKMALRIRGMSTGDPFIARLAVAVNGKAGSWRGGVEILKDMEAVGTPRDVNVYNALIETLVARPRLRPD